MIREQRKSVSGNHDGMDGRHVSIGAGAVHCFSFVASRPDAKMLTLLSKRRFVWGGRRLRSGVHEPNTGVPFSGRAAPKVWFVKAMEWLGCPVERCCFSRTATAHGANTHQRLLWFVGLATGEVLRDDIVAFINEARRHSFIRLRPRCLLRVRRQVILFVDRHKRES